MLIFTQPRGGGGVLVSFKKLKQCIGQLRFSKGKLLYFCLHGLDILLSFLSYSKVFWGGLEAIKVDLEGAPQHAPTSTFA